MAIKGIWFEFRCEFANVSLCFCACVCAYLCNVLCCIFWGFAQQNVDGCRIQRWGSVQFGLLIVAAPPLRSSPPPLLLLSFNIAISNSCVWVPYVNPFCFVAYFPECVECVLCVCVFIAPKLLSDATRYLSCPSISQPFFWVCFWAIFMVLLASIYAEFSMQHFHTLALINPQPAALVNMQADPPQRGVLQMPHCWHL